MRARSSSRCSPSSSRSISPLFGDVSRSIWFVSSPSHQRFFLRTCYSKFSSLPHHFHPHAAKTHGDLFEPSQLKTTQHNLWARYVLSDYYSKLFHENTIIPHNTQPPCRRVICSLLQPLLRQLTGWEMIGLAEWKLGALLGLA
jgi:hypothetical protein